MDQGRGGPEEGPHRRGVVLRRPLGGDVDRGRSQGTGGRAHDGRAVGPPTTVPMVQEHARDLGPLGMAVWGAMPLVGQRPEAPRTHLRRRFGWPDPRRPTRCNEELLKDLDMVRRLIIEGRYRPSTEGMREAYPFMADPTKRRRRRSAARGRPRRIRGARRRQGHRRKRRREAQERPGWNIPPLGRAPGRGNERQRCAPGGTSLHPARRQGPGGSDEREFRSEFTQEGVSE